ncbi:MAG TPA: xanthine dehydrogenase family protein subunit M [Candidatus Limnocylindria bacterium]|nr:xanthine dehydrogenase family protein subunit M [Candidatus Limnocylindria bacterium]
MRPFAFLQPQSVREVVDHLAADPDARILAGGTDLIIGLRDGSVRASSVVDVKRVGELDGNIRAIDGGLAFGALTSMTDIAADERVRTAWTALAEGAAVVGSVQIRNRATLAGNACNASPAADTTPALLIFEAVVVVMGPDGERRIPIDELFVRSRTTTLRRGEVVLRIEIPAPSGRVGSTHARRTRRRGHDLASVTIACSVHESGETRLAFGSVGPRPILVRDDTGMLAAAETDDAERLPILDRLFAEAAPSPRSMRASPEYRQAMLRVLGLRAIAVARERVAGAAA